MGAPESPTEGQVAMSCNFLTNVGSTDCLKVSHWCGCRPNAPQIGQIVVSDKPASAAIERIDRY